jgi:hypothetical protein
MARFNLTHNRRCPTSFFRPSRILDANVPIAAGTYTVNPANFEQGISSLDPAHNYAVAISLDQTRSDGSVLSQSNSFFDFQVLPSAASTNVHLPMVQATANGPCISFTLVLLSLESPSSSSAGCCRIHLPDSNDRPEFRQCQIARDRQFPDHTIYTYGTARLSSLTQPSPPTRSLISRPAA